MIKFLCFYLILILCDYNKETLGDKITDPNLKACLDSKEDKSKPGEDDIKNPPKDKPQNDDVSC